MKYSNEQIICFEANKLYKLLSKYIETYSHCSDVSIIDIDDYAFLFDYKNSMDYGFYHLLIDDFKKLVSIIHYNRNEFDYAFDTQWVDCYNAELYTIMQLESHFIIRLDEWAKDWLLNHNWNFDITEYSDGIHTRLENQLRGDGIYELITYSP